MAQSKQGKRVKAKWECEVKRGRKCKSKKEK